MARRITLLGKIRGIGPDNVEVESPTIIKSKAPAHADDTECTMDMSDDCDAIFSGDSSDEAPLPKDESIETAFVELQHDLREKAEQCDVLRETLSTMSVTMKRQVFQLQEKDKKLETQATLLEEKEFECEQLKLKNAQLCEGELLVEKTAECEQWKLKYEKLCQENIEAAAMPKAVVASILPEAEADNTDMLLGNFRANRPWGRKSSSSAAASNIKKKQIDNNSEHEPSGASDDEDSILQPYPEELDAPCRSNRSDQPAYKRAKAKAVPDDLPETFMSTPMAWIGVVEKAEQEVEQEQQATPTEATTPSSASPINSITAPEASAEEELAALVEEKEVVFGPQEAAAAPVATMPLLDEIVMEEEDEEEEEDSDSDSSSSEDEEDDDDEEEEEGGPSAKDLDKAMRLPTMKEIFVDNADDVSVFSDDEGEGVCSTVGDDASSAKLSTAPSSVVSSSLVSLPKRRNVKEMKKRRSRVRRMARREARNTGFAIEKLEC